MPKPMEGARMKVCLVSPPTVTEFEDLAVVESEAVQIIAEHAPLGILSLAAVLEQQGADVRIVDLNRWYYEYLRTPGGRPAETFCDFAAARLAPDAAEIMGFSTICSSYPLTLRLADQIRQTAPDVPILLGGPQASVVDVSTLAAFPQIDLIVRGEAEQTLPQLLDALSGGGGLDRIGGVTYRRGTEIIRNPTAPVLADLDDLPLPAFHRYPHMDQCRYIPLELGRGCPFGCTFCSTNDFFRRRFRLKSPERVIEQMRAIRDQYGITVFDLVHDMFTVDRRRVVAFCEAMLAAHEGFLWNCSARTDCIDDSLIELMASAGCRGIFFGIETGSPRLQKIIKKRLDLNDARRRIAANDRHQIRTAVSLITGFPDETKDDLRQTVDFFVNSLRKDYARPQLHLLAPLAGTPIETTYRDQLILDDIYSDMSYQGWTQEKVDRELIERHPDVFPNFYAVPTPWLDRSYLKELREFLLNGMERFRWLLVALHQVSGDLLPVFEQWRPWLERDRGGPFTPTAECPTDLAYYAGRRFRRDFIRFLIPRFAGATDSNGRALVTLIRLEEALADLYDVASPAPAAGSSAAKAGSPAATAPVERRPLDAKEPLRPTAVPRTAGNVRLVDATVDYSDLVGCLRERRPFDEAASTPCLLAVQECSGRELLVLQLGLSSADLMRLCDGTSTVGEIAEAFASAGGDVGGVARDKACIFGLEVLRQQGLIQVTA